MNKVCLIGNLTRDPDTRWSTGQNQMAICRFTIGINDGGKDKQASFPSIVAFGKTAEACDKYLSKGSKVGIEGHIQTGSYEKDGRKIYTTDVIADRVDFLTSKQEKKQDDQYVGFYPADDDLPFE